MSEAFEGSVIVQFGYNFTLTTGDEEVDNDKLETLFREAVKNYPTSVLTTKELNEFADLIESLGRSNDAQLLRNINLNTVIYSEGDTFVDDFSVMDDDNSPGL
jgi:hypothetical protein